MPVLNPLVGIDLGTTFSAISIVNPDTSRAEIIPSPEQERITASVVLIEDGDNIIVGKIAKQNAVADPDKVVEFVKREMGKPKEDILKGNEVVLRGWKRKLGGKTYGAQEISAFILKKLKTDAETRLGMPVTDAVITCPAYFGDGQRAATKEAGIIAGFNVLGILDEPIAAALAYGMDKLDRDQRVFVFDLGGGTFDVVILEIKGGSIREIAINGDHMLGGKDWDDALIEYVAGQFGAKYGSSPLTDNSSYQDLQLRAIQAKESLTRLPKTTIMCGHAGNKLAVEITRKKFEELTAHLVDNCRVLCATVLSEAKLAWKDIDTVLLVGGSTRMPMIGELVSKISGKTPCVELNPDECVAQGAAWQALILAKERGVDTGEAGRLMPQGLNVQKVTSHNLGEVADRDEVERVFLMIPKFTPVPCTQTHDFATKIDNQRGVRMRVMEGGDMDADGTCSPSAATQIGEATITDLPPSPKGSPIKITFNFNKDGVLEASGVHVPSGRQAKVTIERAGSLSAAEMNIAVARMKTTNISG